MPRSRHFPERNSQRWVLEPVYATGLLEPWNRSKEGHAMLVLTRKIDEAIMIGDAIKIVVVDVRGDQVKLGIEAPQDVAIHRQEVYEDIQTENRRAAVTKPVDVRSLTDLLDKHSDATKSSDDR